LFHCRGHFEAYRQTNAWMSASLMFLTQVRGSTLWETGMAPPWDVKGAARPYNRLSR